MNQISTSIPVEGAKPKSVSSLYVLKALLAFVVVTCHSPLVLPWVYIPGFVVELFFAITGEINLDGITKILGMNITFVTSAQTDEEGYALLKEFGLPFKNAKKGN